VRWPRVSAALVGLSWFVALGGGPTLNPVNTGWLLAGDWRQHWLGWLFFRREPWTFPLGTIASLPYPAGTTIGFTDSNPLVSLLLRPFSGFLPSEFQFIGPWLACCFLMQGYAGAALTSTVSPNRLQQFLGGSLFAMSPVLALRVGHDTLCAQWLLIGLLYLGLKACDDERQARREAWLAAGVPALAGAIHPYLAAATLALACAAFGRSWRAKLISPARAVVLVAIATGGLVAVFGLLGYGGDAGTGSAGFGVYSADLVALIDPRDSSRVLPSFGIASNRWEGFGYLGLGGLMAVALAVVAAARSRPSWRAGTGFVVAACVLMGVYALSVKVTLMGVQVARLHGLYDRFHIVTNAFRSSGRFIWPLHYLTLLVGVWGATRIAGPSRRAVGTALLAVAVLLQAYDFNADPQTFATKPFRQAPVQDFDVAAGRYRHMAMYPMQVLAACGDTYEEDHVYRYMLEAYRLRTTFNSGIFARLPLERVQRACADLSLAVEDGRLDPDTIYVVSPGSVASMTRADAVCGRFDGDWICVSRDSDAVFRRYLETGRVQ